MEIYTFLCSFVPPYPHGQFIIFQVIFRAALPDLQTQNPQNRSNIPPVLYFQIEQIQPKSERQLEEVVLCSSLRTIFHFSSVKICGTDLEKKGGGLHVSWIMIVWVFFRGLIRLLAVTRFFTRCNC